MTKDRLGELLQLSKRSKDVNINIDNSTTQPPHENDLLRSTFQRAEVVGQWIYEIERNVEKIRSHIYKLHDIHSNHSDLSIKIDAYFQNNTNIYRKANDKLKEMEEELKATNSETAEGRIKSIQFNTLKNRYISIFKSNNLELENYRNLQKDKLEVQLKAKGVKVTDEELVALLNKKVDFQVFTENIIVETAEAKQTLANIEERHQQLLRIERMLIEVRDLFLQMAILIDNQQDLIDRVEYQAQLATEYVGKTPKAISKAARRRRRYFKCKIVMAVISVVIIFIFLISFLK